MLLGFLDVEDLSAQRHDGLEVAVATHLRRAACRVTLHEEDFGDRAVAARTVGQLARQTRARKHGLALHQLARMACGMTRRGGQNHFLHDGAGIFRILLQVVAQSRRKRLVHGRRHLVVAELGLGLAFELRLGHLDRHHGRKTFAEVVAVDVELELGEHARVVGVLLQRARERAPEAREVRAALDGVDVIDVGVHVLRVGVVVLHGHLHRHAVLLRVEVDDRLDDGGAARGVEVTHELLQTLLRVEPFAQRLALLVALTLVREAEVYALVEECQLAQAVGQDFVFVFGRVGEDVAVGLERDGRTAVRAFAHDLHLRGRHALAVRLAEDAAVAVHLGHEARREGIDARYAHAVQTARDLVAALVELTARMEHRQNHFEGRFALLFVEIGRNAAAVVAHGDRVVLVDRNVDMGAVTRQRLVDRVVHHLVYEVVQTLLADVADIHRRAFAYRFETLQHLNVRCRVGLFLPFYVFCFCTHFSC